MNQAIITTLETITPHDSMEQQHIMETLAWVKSGAPIFRIEKPATPPQHLCSYCVPFDREAQKILLVHHKKSGLILPPGGHVDMGEHPKETAKRECFEELQLDAKFIQDDPFFLTVTKTVGLTAGHVDVSLWYVIEGNHQAPSTFDEEEFEDIKWYALNDIPFEQSDCHMRRFVKKLERLMPSP